MRYEIMFDKNESFVTGRMFGELSVGGHQLFLRDLLAHPKWKTGMNVLIDNRAASLVNVTLDDLQRVSLMVKYLKDALV